MESVSLFGNLELAAGLGLLLVECLGRAASDPVRRPVVEEEDQICS